MQKHNILGVVVILVMLCTILNGLNSENTLWTSVVQHELQILDKMVSVHHIVLKRDVKSQMIE
jgi:Na+(H+)/acetate symporter ActP